jgi:O-antigen/teichoic acid export membrane protein
MVRHLWRMNFSLFVATASFFLGQASDPAVGRNGLRARLFTKAVRATGLPLVPVFLVLILMIYWILRVKFGKQYKRGAESRPREAPVQSIPGITATTGGSK